MAVNKVCINGETILDLSGDSVTPETLLAGATAHNAAGAQIVGTANPGGGGGITLSPSALYAAIVSSGTQVQNLNDKLDVATGQVYAGAWLALKGSGGATAILYIPINGTTTVYGYDTVYLIETALYSDAAMTSWQIVTQADAESGEVLTTENVAEVYYLLV